VKLLLAAKRAFLLLAALLCFFTALMLVNHSGLPERASYSGLVTDLDTFAPEVGALAPPFTTTNIDGEVVNLLELRGSPVIINFWATWCGPCAAEMPELQAFYEARQRDGIRMLGINLSEGIEQILPWVEQYRLTLDVLLDPHGEIAGVYRLRGQPSTYIVSPEGVITHIFYGPTTLQQLEMFLPPTL
jgi:peroxiredoxin